MLSLLVKCCKIETMDHHSPRLWSCQIFLWGLREFYTGVAPSAPTCHSLRGSVCCLGCLRGTGDSRVPCGALVGNQSSPPTPTALPRGILIVPQRRHFHDGDNIRRFGLQVLEASSCLPSVESNFPSLPTEPFGRSSSKSGQHGQSGRVYVWASPSKHERHPRMRA